MARKQVKKQTPTSTGEEQAVKLVVVNNANTALTDLPVKGLTVRKASESALAELETFHLVGEDGKPIDDEMLGLLQATTTRIKGILRTRLIGAIEIGRILIDLKDRIPYGVFMLWFDQALASYFSIDSASNYMNLAKLHEQYSIDQLQSLPLAALYLVGRHTVPIEVQEEVLTRIAPAAVEAGTPLGKKETKQIITQYRRLQLQAADIDPDVRPLLIASKVAEQADELNRFKNLSKRKQREVAEILREQKTLDVKQALQILRQETEDPTEDEPLEAEIVSVEQNIIAYRGNWLEMLGKLDSESVDLCFAEMPLSKERLGDYRLLADQMARILKPGGMLLSVVSQPNIQFVGNYLDPLQVLWTFMIMRRSGHSPRIVGRVSFASSYVPLSLSYKPPLKLIPGLIDDLRISTDVGNYESLPEDILKFNFDQAAETTEVPEQFEEEVALTSIESSVDYYLSRLLQSTDVFLHLVPNLNTSFGISEHLYHSAMQKASKIYSLIGQ